MRKDGKEIDRREEEIGFRYFHADAEKGFFLNGKPYRLNGVNRHQDRAERASAFYPQDHDEDLDLMQEMGCNAVRLCHYPQAKYMHQQMDKRGLVAWAEIPFVNVYVNNPAYDENLRLQLKELILQNYNHPCILFWGLFNEINSGWLDRPSRMAAELHALARQLDPSRPTMGASNQDDDFNGFTDLIAFNKYFGWYGDNMDDMGRACSTSGAEDGHQRVWCRGMRIPAGGLAEASGTVGAMASRKLADLLSCGELETASGTRILVVQLHLVHVRLFGGRP